MNDPNSALQIDASLRLPVYAGEWIPVTLLIQRPDSWTQAVRLRNLVSEDREIYLDLNVFEWGTQVRPGETYRLTIPIRVTHPRTVNLSAIKIEVEDIDNHDPRERFLVNLPAKTVEVRPAIAQEIAVQVTPICAYEEGTKVRLNLKHIGQTEFREFTVNLMPEEAVRAGKRTTLLPNFKPSNEEEFELVLTQKELEVVMVGSVGEQRPEARWLIAISDPPRSNERLFRFLHPRLPSLEQPAIFEEKGDGWSPISPVHGSFRLHGGKTYKIVIRPQHSDVSEVKVRDIPGVLHVKDRRKDETGAWEFTLDVTYKDLFADPETLYFDVAGAKDRLTGEISVCFKPARLKHWQVAAALGLFLTVQGIGAVAHFLQKADFDIIEAASHFKLTEDYNLFYLSVIPLILLFLRIGDWVQYRLQT